MNTFYFAYGSNMNPVRIRQRIPQARLVGKATIKGWRLVERLYADIERAKGRTVEFRFFNGTTHAGEVKAAVQLAILICLRAKNAKASSAKNPRPYSEASAKYDFRVFLIRLGANGNLFKTMRFHLCKNLPGSAAWKDGRHD